MRSRYHFSFTQRQPLYFRVIVTNRCNNNCVYCFKEADVGRQEGGFSLAFFRELARIGKKYGIPKVHFTGGEPLLEDRLVSFIQSIKRESNTDIGLSTNGRLLKSYSRRLYKAGLTRINLSIPTLDTGKYGLICGQNALSEVLENLEDLISLGYDPVKINVPIFKRNVGEMPDFLSYFLTREKTILRFFSILPNPGLQRKDCLTDDEITSALEEGVLALPGYLRQESAKRVFYRAPSIPSLRMCQDCPHKAVCQDQAKAIRITKDGKFSLCLANPRYSLQAKNIRDIDRVTRRLLEYYC